MYPSVWSSMNIEDDRLLGYVVKHQKYMYFLLSLARREIPERRLINKAWILIRKQKAVLINKYPIVIQLKRGVKTEEQDESKFVMGVDDGSVYVGISVVQKCETTNKPIFKGTIEQRKDVKGLMNTRRGYRRYKSITRR